MRISDVLRGKGDLVVTIAPDDPVTALLDALAEHRVGALVVSPDGRIVTSGGVCDDERYAPLLSRILTRITTPHTV